MTQAEQLAAQAAQWQAAGRPDMAAQLYSTALDQDPSKFAMRMQLAECLAQLHQNEQAAEQYLMVAQAYAARGRHQECLALCERIINIAPQAFVYMSVGPMVRRIGRHARPLCARAAEIHLAAGRQTDGLQILRLGAELDPHNSDVRRQLARIYQARHMNREAVEALADAGDLLVQAKRYPEYIEVAQQILALQPEDVSTLRELPRVYLELRKPHEAVRALGALTKVSPGDIAGYEILAQAFAVIGRTDKSISVLERLLEELGATGQSDKANMILNHARYWRPTDVGFLRSLKRIEIPRARPAKPSGPPPASAPEGTVVLNIADLMLEEGSRRAGRPGREDSSVQLVEADGALIVNLDDLIDESSEAPTMPPMATPASPPPLPPASGLGATPPPPPRPSSPPIGDDPATVSLDAGSLMAALQGDRPTLSDMPAIEDDEVLEGPPTIPTMLEVERPPSTSSISALIYDDADDDDNEPATKLHMKALTAEDIARAQQRLSHAAPVDLDAPTLAPGAIPPLPPEDELDDLDEPTPQPGTLSPLPPEDELDELDEPTPRPGTLSPLPPLQREADLDAPTLAPGAIDAPTMARLQPITAQDIARSLANQRRAEAGDDDVTLAPSSRAATPSAAPEQPPLLSPSAQAVPNDEEEATRLHMDALRPEDIERALRQKKSDKP